MRGEDGAHTHFSRSQSFFPIHHTTVLTLMEPEAGSVAELQAQLTVREALPREHRSS